MNSKYIGRYKNIPSNISPVPIVNKYAINGFVNFQSNLGIEDINLLRDFGICFYGGNVLQNNDFKFNVFSTFIKKFIDNTNRDRVSCCLFTNKTIYDNSKYFDKTSNTFRALFSKDFYGNVYSFDSFSQLLKDLLFRLKQDIAYNNGCFTKTMMCFIIVTGEEIRDCLSNIDKDLFTRFLREAKSADFFPVFICEKYDHDLASFITGCEISLPQVALFDEKKSMIEHNPHFPIPQIKSTVRQYGLALLYGYDIIIPCKVLGDLINIFERKDRVYQKFRFTEYKDRTVRSPTRLWRLQTLLMKRSWYEMINKTRDETHCLIERIKYE